MSVQLKKSSRPAGIDVGNDYCVKIPFNLSSGEVNEWNEHCVTAIEMFGLQGDKYVCRFTSSAIEFWFRDDKDAIMFELTCG